MPSPWPWTMWPPRRSDALIASSRLTLAPGSMAPERGDLEGLVHRLDLEADVVDRGRREADAVDGDRVALADLGDQAGGDMKPGAVAAAVDVLDLADVLDQAGEHVTTPGSGS